MCVCVRVYLISMAAESPGNLVVFLDMEGRPYRTSKCVFAPIRPKWCTANGYPGHTGYIAQRGSLMSQRMIATESSQ